MCHLNFVLGKLWFETGIVKRAWEIVKAWDLKELQNILAGNFLQFQQFGFHCQISENIINI